MTALDRKGFAKLVYDTTAGCSPQKVIDEYADRLADIVDLKRAREEERNREREACRTVEKQLAETVEALDKVTASFRDGAAAWRARAVVLTKERDDALEVLEACKGPLINAADVLDILSKSEVLGPEARLECAKWEKECRAAHAYARAVPVPGCKACRDAWHGPHEREARRAAYRQGWRACVGFIEMSRDTFRPETTSRAACEVVLADLRKAEALPFDVSEVADV
jgi:hypothetical protein